MVAGGRSNPASELKLVMDSACPSLVLGLASVAQTRFKECDIQQQQLLPLFLLLTKRSLLTLRRGEAILEGKMEDNDYSKITVKTHFSFFLP